MVKLIHFFLILYFINLVYGFYYVGGDNKTFIERNDILVPIVVVSFLFIVLLICYSLNMFDSLEFGILGEHKFKFERRLPMDGFRGVLALIVAYYHSELSAMYERRFGTIDPFFIISGYVITTVILKAACTDHGFSFATFYARRFRRLLPSSTIVLLSTLLLYKYLYTPEGLYKYKNSFLAAATYTENLYEIRIQTDYFLKDQPQSPVLQFWSIGVEEQFYLVWPTMLITMNYFCKRSSKKLLSIFTFVAVCALFISFYSGWDPVWVYFAPQFKLYQLLSGSIIGILIITFGGKLPQNHILSRILVYFGFGIIAILLLDYLQHTLNLVGFYLSVSAIVIIFGLEISERSYPAIILSTPLFQFLGSISYEIYLWHFPIINIGNTIGHSMENRNLYIESTIELVIIIILSYITRIISIKIMMQPAKDWIVSFVAITSILITVGIISIVCTPVAPHNNNDLLLNVNDVELTDIDKEVNAAIEKYPSLPIKDILGPDEMFNKTLFPNLDYIPAFGDSHAKEWVLAFENLSRKHHIFLRVLFEVTCPWVRNIDIFNKNGNCKLMRDQIPLQKEQNPKAMILFSASILYSEIKYYAEENYITYEDPRYFEILEYGIHSTTQSFPENMPIIIVHTHPVLDPNFDSEMILLKNNNISVPIGQKEKKEMMRDFLNTLPSKYPNIFVISLSDLICKQGYCNIVENGVLQFRDNHHITQEYAVTIEDQFWDKIEPIIYKT